MNWLTSSKRRIKMPPLYLIVSEWYTLPFLKTQHLMGTEMSSYEPFAFFEKENDSEKII